MLCTHLLPLVDVETVILQFLFKNIWDVDVNVDQFLLAFPLDVTVWFNLLGKSWM